MNAQRTQSTWLPALAASLATLVSLVVLQVISHVLLNDAVAPFFGTDAPGSVRSSASLLVMVVVTIGAVGGLVHLAVRGSGAGSTKAPTLLGSWGGIVLGVLVAQLAGFVTAAGAGRTLGSAMGTGAATGACVGWVGALVAVALWQRTRRVETAQSPAATAGQPHGDGMVGPNGYALKRKSDYLDHAHMPGEPGGSDRRVEDRRSEDSSSLEEADATVTAADDSEEKEIWTEERRDAYRLAQAEAELNAEGNLDADEEQSEELSEELYGTYAAESEPVATSSTWDSYVEDPPGDGSSDLLADSTSWGDVTWAELPAELTKGVDEPKPYVGKRSAGAYVEDAEAEIDADAVLAGHGSHRADK